MFELAHDPHPLGQLHEHHPHILGHAQQQLAQTFQVVCITTLRLLVEVIDDAHLAHPVHQLGHRVGEDRTHIVRGQIPLAQTADKASDQGIDIHLQGGEDIDHRACATHDILAGPLLARQAQRPSQE